MISRKGQNGRATMCRRSMTMARVTNSFKRRKAFQSYYGRCLFASGFHVPSGPVALSASAVGAGLSFPDGDIHIRSMGEQVEPNEQKRPRSVSCLLCINSALSLLTRLVMLALGFASQRMQFHLGKLTVFLRRYFTVLTLIT